MTALRIGLALGGGGARGLAHVHALEAFDELGVRAAAIAGTSIGSLFGAGYAAGLSGRDLHEHVAGMLKRRGDVLVKIMKARIGRMTDLFGAGSRNPALLDAERLIAQFLPEFMPKTFEELEVPFAAVATDFFGREAVVYRSGEILPAIAASAAIPGLFRPVSHDGRTLIDGAMTNPLPFDVFRPGEVEVTLAVDVTGGPVVLGHRAPNALEVGLGATQIMQAAIVAGKIAQKGPDALIRPKVETITLLDFLKSGAVLQATVAAKEETKRALEALLAR